MKRAYWWFFLAWQVTGILPVVLGVILFDGLPFVLSWIMLLPGSLVLFLFPPSANAEANWSIWWVCAAALTINTLLISAVSFLVGRFGKSRSTTAA
jgi:hypothetical protein